MASKQLSWVWTDENGSMQGAIADLQRRVIHWFAAPGCACGSHDDAQTIRDFLARGSRYLNPSDDVLEEMRAALAAHV